MRQDVTAETITTTLINTDKWNVNPDNSLPIEQILSVVPRLLTDKVSLKYDLSGLKRFLTDKLPPPLKFFPKPPLPALAKFPKETRNNKQKKTLRNSASFSW